LVKKIEINQNFRFAPRVINLPMVSYVEGKVFPPFVLVVAIVLPTRGGCLLKALLTLILRRNILL